MTDMEEDIKRHQQETFFEQITKSSMLPCTTILDENNQPTGTLGESLREVIKSMGGGISISYNTREGLYLTYQDAVERLTTVQDVLAVMQMIWH